MQVITFGEAGIALYGRGCGQDNAWLCLLNFSAQPALIYMPGEGSAWRKLLDSNDTEWQEDVGEGLRGPVAALSTESITVGPLSVTVYRGYDGVV